MDDKVEFKDLPEKPGSTYTDSLETIRWDNPLSEVSEISLVDYFQLYKTRIIQESEKLFVTDFLYPILGKENMKYLIPQFPFIDSEGRTRRIDFVIQKNGKKLALEVNGEVYHSEGIIPNETFDDNLNRQNEILIAGYQLLRFSYSQLQHPIWRKRVSETIRSIILKQYPELFSGSFVKPNPLQMAALNALDFYRSMGWKKGIVILPTGTGKTFLSALDSKKVDGRILFIVHRLDILSQSREAFEIIFPNEKLGLLTGDVKENVKESKILFASKDSVRNLSSIYNLPPTEFDYIIIDEVHHSQASSYQFIFQYFNPSKFLLGLTATPDRMDRKDIFALFDYQKVFESSLNEAIENGYLVPYIYYGLKDNIDYSNIRYNGNKYNVNDLDKYLIIEERNKLILKEYLEKGEGNKAVGFCCSIKHAEAMANFFTKNGISSYAITSETPNRDDLIKNFRKNKFPVVFTVDLFNEGIDFPDLRVLLFLRPTESKTVFMQQLGRGLRLCNGKSSVVILDFISNYKKANNIRKYLSTKKSAQMNSIGRIEKIIYNYAPKCVVQFDSEVEQILDSQDKAEREITKEDLIAAYYEVAEKVTHKPSQQEINSLGEYKIARYMYVFRSWVGFLREIGEFTEASYHFPQGTHLGHVLYILKVCQNGEFTNTLLDPKYIKLRGSFDAGRLGTLQRQTKYKLQAMMELGFIIDDRKLDTNVEYTPELTYKGRVIAKIFNQLLEETDFSFIERDGESWEMKISPEDFNISIKEFLEKNESSLSVVTNIFLDMPAVALMLKYLYQVERKKIITKRSIYQNFFNAPFVSLFCDQNGIEAATVTGAGHRCPFLLNILESLGILKQNTSDLELIYFLLIKDTVKLSPEETDNDFEDRMLKIQNSPESLSPEEQSKLRELYGKEFLTKNYFLSNYRVIKHA